MAPLDQTIAARLQAIVAAAEREADAARRDIAEHRRVAEQEAREYLESSRRQADERSEGRARLLEQLTAEAQHEAEAVRDRLGRLAGAVEELSRVVRGGDAATAPVAGPPWSAEQPPPFPADSPDDLLPPELRSAAPARERAPVAAGEPDAARLAAIEMAVGGASRGEVERHLERQFGVDSPTALLDRVFGPQREPTTRLTWGRP
jgi:ABC-type transporter Mla subunit MlaD